MLKKHSSIMFDQKWIIDQKLLISPFQQIEFASHKHISSFLGTYFPIDCFLGDAFGVLSWQFWSTVLQCGARLQIHKLNTGPCSQCCQFSNWGCVLCDIAHGQSVAVLYVCCTRSDVNRCTLFMMHYLCHMCQCGYRGCFGRIPLYTYGPPRCRTSQYRMTFILLSVSLWNDFSDPVWKVWD